MTATRHTFGAPSGGLSLRTRSGTSGEHRGVVLPTRLVGSSHAERRRAGAQKPEHGADEDGDDPAAQVVIPRQAIAPPGAGRPRTFADRATRARSFSPRVQDRHEQLQHGTTRGRASGAAARLGGRIGPMDRLDVRQFAKRLRGV